jgi:hypothetical protein
MRPSCSLYFAFHGYVLHLAKMVFSLLFGFQF